MFHTNMIDKLMKEQARLKIQKQKTEDRMKAQNSRIENRIQILERRSLIIKQNCDDAMAEIDRRLEKNREQINLEKKYYNSIGE